MLTRLSEQDNVHTQKKHPSHYHVRNPNYLSHYVPNEWPDEQHSIQHVLLRPHHPQQHFAYTQWHIDLLLSANQLCLQGSILRLQLCNFALERCHLHVHLSLPISILSWHTEFSLDVLSEPVRGQITPSAKSNTMVQHTHEMQRKVHDDGKQKKLKTQHQTHHARVSNTHFLSSSFSARTSFTSNTVISL